MLVKQKRQFFLNLAALLLAFQSFQSFACNCQMNTTVSGSDFDQPTAIFDNFSCTGGTINSATLTFTLNGTCSYSQARIIVDGVQVASGICGTYTFDLTPYLPLSNVSVQGYDNPSDMIADFITINAMITLNGSTATNPPTVGFTAPDFQCVGTPISFTNTSTCGTSYQWNFGDGSSSNDFEPVHTYAQPGYYWVSLSTMDGFGNTIGWENHYVIVSGSSNTMYIDQDTVCVGDEVYFHDNSYFNNSNNVSYLINFGDGNTATSNNNWASFQHAYSAVGDYTVTLTVNSDCGTQVIDTMIHVGNNLPVNSFLQVGTGTGGGIFCPGTAVNLYTDWSMDYLFSYGDGTTGTEQGHVYNTYGTYFPTVTVQNGCGNVATYSSPAITIANVSYYTGETYMSVGNNAICPNSQANFYGPTASSYYWTFGDGGTSTLRDPQHVYGALGNYPVSLTITDGCGNDTTLTNYINVVPNIPISPDVELDADMPDQICVSDIFRYNIDGGYQYGESGSILWNFGDGTTSTSLQGFHGYSTAGTYTITATITNTCGNDTTLTMQMTAGTNIPPQNVFASTIDETFCPGDNILLINQPYNTANTVVWDMGNGDFVNSTDSLVINQEGTEMIYNLATYSYTTPGVYNVTATVTNACGLSASEDIMITISQGTSIGEVGFFVEEDEYFCIGEQIEFKGYGGNEFYWNFGDNSGIEVTTEALSPIYHHYTQPGVYTVSMIAFNNCGDSAVFTQQVLIPDSQMNIITNTQDATCLENDGLAIVNVIGPNPPYSYTWSNGDNNNIAEDLYAGIYVVNVTDSKGCTSFGIATVSDEQAPTIAVSNVIPVSCYGEDNGAIDITVIGNTSGVQYYWSNGETTEDVNGLVAGPYEITVTNGQGCVSVESVMVTQPDEVTVAFSSSPATCNLMNGSATAVVNGTTGPYLYIWSNGQSNPTATGLAGGIYTVSVIDNESCLTTATVAVNETNAPGIILDSLSNMGCGEGGSGIYISLIGGTDPYTYLWSTGATTPSLVGIEPDQYSVTVTGADGCSSIELFDIEYESPVENPICVVTVTSSQNNKIAWEKVATTGVESYNIYRESSSAGLYYLIGNVPYDSLSIFVDTVSNPAVQAYRYKIAAVDSCGTESDISAHHKTIHLTQNIGIGGEVNLIWDHYEGFGYATFNILRFDNVNGWQQLTSLPSNVNSYSDLAAPIGTATSLHYLVEIELDDPCISTKAENNNTTRSNRTEAVAGPLDDAGLEELLSSNIIEVYPNPTNGVVSAFAYLGSVSNVECQLIDAQGRTILSKTINKLENGDLISMDATKAESGIYLLRIQVGEKIYFERVMVQK